MRHNLPKYSVWLSHITSLPLLIAYLIPMIMLSYLLIILPDGLYAPLSRSDESFVTEEVHLILSFENSFNSFIASIIGRYKQIFLPLKALH